MGLLRSGATAGNTLTQAGRQTIRNAGNTCGQIGQALSRGRRCFVPPNSSRLRHPRLLRRGSGIAGFRARYGLGASSATGGSMATQFFGAKDVFDRERPAIPVRAAQKAAGI